METIQQFELINNQYTPTQAKDVLVALLNHKINFNHMAAFGGAERGEDVTHYRKRVEELKEVRNNVLSLIGSAAEGGFELQIQGSFKVTLVEQPAAPVMKTVVEEVGAREPEYYLA